jgi:hypothetical protein
MSYCQLYRNATSCVSCLASVNTTWCSEDSSCWNYPGGLKSGVSYCPSLCDKYVTEPGSCSSASGSAVGAIIGIVLLILCCVCCIGGIAALCLGACSFIGRKVFIDEHSGNVPQQMPNSFVVSPHQNYDPSSSNNYGPTYGPGASFAPASSVAVQNHQSDDHHYIDQSYIQTVSAEHENNFGSKDMQAVEAQAFPMKPTVKPQPFYISSGNNLYTNNSNNNNNNNNQGYP